MSVAIVAMAPVFSMIIKAICPDVSCGATSRPSCSSRSTRSPGPRLVVPVEVDHWRRLGTACSTTSPMARTLGQALRPVSTPARRPHDCRPRVPHLHLHVFPAYTLGDFSFAKAGPDPDRGTRVRQPRRSVRPFVTWGAGVRPRIDGPDSALRRCGGSPAAGPLRRPPHAAQRQRW